MSNPDITSEMFEGLDFDERVQLRRDLIAKYGTSLPNAQDDSDGLFSKKKVTKKNGNVLPERGDETAFENLTFDERVEIRKKMIAAYGTSLPNTQDDSDGLFSKKKVTDKEGNVLPRRGDETAFENLNFDERVEIR